MTEAPLHEYLRQHARNAPDKTAIIWYGNEISYAELDRLSDAFAVFLHRLGIVKGEPVALFMQNCPQYIIAHFGIQKLGAIVSPCSPLFKRHELNYQLQDLGSRIIIAADDLYPVVAEGRHDTCLEHVILAHYADLLPSAPTYKVPDEFSASRDMPLGEGVHDMKAALHNSAEIAVLADQTIADVPLWPALSLDDVALLAYTSGTTGRPKGAMLTYGNALFKARCGANVSKLSATDVHLVIPPLYHISGMLCGINIPVYLGGTIVLHYRFNPVSALQSIQAHRPHYWKGIAPMLTAMMESAQPGDYDLSSLQRCPMTSFGIRVTPELAHRWAAFSGGARVHEAGYGMTETHTFDSLMPPDAIKWGTNGILGPGVECRIVDPANGLEVPCGNQGEIFLRSLGNFIGYWKQPEKTREVLVDGWVNTGDIGKLDEDGYLTLLGRNKEMIKVSGYSVFPEDVEALLLRHPHIAQVGVTGVEDNAKGQVVKATIVPRDDSSLSSDDVIEWSKENMSAYKVPRLVEFRDSLPMTASGKVIRRLL